MEVDTPTNLTARYDTESVNRPIRHRFSLVFRVQTGHVDVSPEGTCLSVARSK